MQVHRTFEERLYIVRQILSGKALRPLSREYHVGRENVRQWVLRYQTYGEEGLRLSHPGHYSSEEKIAIVKEFLEKGPPSLYKQRHSTQLDIKGRERSIA